MKYLYIVTILIATLFLGSCSDSQPINTPPTKKPKDEKLKRIEKLSKPKKVDLKEEPKATIKKEVQVEPIPKEQLEKAKAILASVSKEEVEKVDGKAKFKMLCAACHGFTGDLMVNGAKDLTVSKISKEESIAQIYFGRGLMTPFKGMLKDPEIVAVVNYIETLRK